MCAPNGMAQSIQLLFTETIDMPWVELLFGWTSGVKPNCARYSLVTSSWPSIQKFICSVIHMKPYLIVRARTPLVFALGTLPFFQQATRLPRKQWYSREVRQLVHRFSHQMIRDDLCIGRPLVTPFARANSGTYSDDLWWNTPGSNGAWHGLDTQMNSCWMNASYLYYSICVKVCPCVSLLWY